MEAMEKCNTASNYADGADTMDEEPWRMPATSDEEGDAAEAAPELRGPRPARVPVKSGARVRIEGDEYASFSVRIALCRPKPCTLNRRPQTCSQMLNSAPAMCIEVPGAKE